MDPNETRRELAARLERSFQRLSADQERLGTPATAVKKLATLQAIIEAMRAQPAPAAPTVALTLPEALALFSFYEDAIDAIQSARYSVRFGKPLTAEPAYPREREAVVALLRRLLEELRALGAVTGSHAIPKEP